MTSLPGPVAQMQLDARSGSRALRHQRGLPPPPPLSTLSGPPSQKPIRSHAGGNQTSRDGTRTRSYAAAAEQCGGGAAEMSLAKAGRPESEREGGGGDGDERIGFVRTLFPCFLPSTEGERERGASMVSAI
ncbi:hypothetical protein CRG98_014788 [Punica granatum]|uniref:Uncharacterized protein n=1 Tax=Punica granatum TaxID=22663 RepID=A0A2I0K8C9_PUNGR|nr:hypothetical protein CRG98_014788 [Punica granatum]